MEKDYQDFKAELSNISYGYVLVKNQSYIDYVFNEYNELPAPSKDRYITATATAKKLGKVFEAMFNIDSYLGKHDNIDNYQAYGEKKAYYIISLLNGTPFKNDILLEIISKSISYKAIVLSIDNEVGKSREQQRLYAEMMEFINAIFDKELKSYKGSSEKKLIGTALEFKTLSDAVVNKDAEDLIYSILSDNSIVDVDTHYFKDPLKGNKGAFYSTLMEFYNKGYFKRKPKIKEYLSICQNNFKVDISEGTAKDQGKPGCGLKIPPFTQKH